MTSPPVLFLVFKRPDTTARVFEAIRAARPPRLYVAADGPRPDRLGESERCEQARWIATDVDWPCDVRTLFRDVNLGCRESVSGAISWFFEYEEQGIILEDDCLPAPSFFTFCDKLLERFHDDERVMCITGNNFQNDMGDYPYSYYFSKYNHCWGWASWRRAWKMFDKNLENLPEFKASGALAALSSTREFSQYWERVFQQIRDGLDTWDYQWTFSCWSQNGLTCTPRVNLISNIGFGADATHTTDSNYKFAQMPTGALTMPLAHPSFVASNPIFDSFVDRTVFGIDVPHPPRELRSIPGRAGRKLLRKLRRGLRIEENGVA